MRGVREFTLTDDEWGEVKLLVTIPRGDDSWGPLAPLRGTPWGDQIHEVPGDALSHALHGWATPLMRVIGVEPWVHALRVSLEDGRCRLYDGCLGAGKFCRPSPKLPECYEAPLDGLASEVASYVALAWKEGRYVLVPDGPEFNIT